jgi:hypothetical protein
MQSKNPDMTIRIRMQADAFVNKSFPEAMGMIDTDKSLRNFERMLEVELAEMYPGAEIEVNVGDFPITTIHLNHEDISSTSQGDAMRVYGGIRYAIDKLFFYGQFWEDKKLVQGS